MEGKGREGKALLDAGGSEACRVGASVDGASEPTNSVTLR